jgi:hypothetical protein
MNSDIFVIIEQFTNQEKNLMNYDLSNYDPGDDDIEDEDDDMDDIENDPYESEYEYDIEGLDELEENETDENYYQSSFNPYSEDD